MIKYKKTAVLALMVFLLSAVNCAKKEEGVSPGAAEPTVDGSQTAVQLAGSGSFCAVNTTVGGSYAYVYSLTLNADGTYNYAVYLTDAATCATAQNSAGNNYATYSQSGTYVVQGTAGTPTTGTKVTFTFGSALMTVRSATYGTIPQNLATWLNGQCTPNPAFSTVADQTKTLQGNSCNGSGGYTGYDFSDAGDTFTNTVYNSGNVLQAGASSGQDLWRVGGSTYPSSYTFTFLGW